MPTYDFARVFNTIIFPMAGSVGIPLITSFIWHGLTPEQQVIIGAFSFVAILIIQLNWSLDSVIPEVKRLTSFAHDQQKWLETGNKRLLDIEMAWEALSRSRLGGTDLFCAFFDRKLSEFVEHISAAAHKGELRIDQNHLYNTDTILTVFDGSNTNEFFEIYIVDEDNELLDFHTLNYFVKLHQKTNEGKIKKIRSLFVLPERASESGALLRQLLRFHECNESYEYKLILKTNYEEFLKDAGLDRQYVDFGIYGEKYIFLTISYRPTPSGIFSKDAALISRYTEYFNSCWQSGASYQLEGIAGEGGITLKEISEYVRNLTIKTPDVKTLAIKNSDVANLTTKK